MLPVKLVKQALFQARLNEAQPAIAFSGGVATYGMLAKTVEAAVAVLEALKLPRGSMVMLDIRNPVQHTALMLGLGLLGLPSASVSSTFSIEKAGKLPKLFLTDREGVSLPGIETRITDERWFAYDASVPVDYARLLSLPGFGPEEIVRYVYSSGTTGYPKCVALSEQTLNLRVAHTILTTVLSPGGAALNMLGFSTIAGIMAPMIALPLGMLLCFANGNAEALQMTRLFNVSALSLAVIQLHGFLQLLANQPPPPSLKLVVVAGSKMPIRLLHEARARLCNNIALGYGSTEMGSMTGGNGISLELHEGSAGYIRPWVEMEAVDAAGQPVPLGTDGILRARSPEMASYASDAGDTVEMFKDGWFYPGDVGRIFPDGLVVITGRTNEVINRGGVIVAPEVIEEVLRLDPTVKDVAVVGVPNAAGLEEIWAAVVSDSPVDANAIAGRARDKLNEKVPDRILRIDTVPRNENGKITRNALREQLIAQVRS
jgi:acyl-coenzyme A synthetase/AMP-(fatty) acid ligase